MICEKCGKEIPENETVCSCCNEEVVAEQTEEVTEVVEATEEVAIDVQDLGAPVSTVVRGKRGKARVTVGIIALVLMAAVLVVSFLKPVLIIGNWSLYQEMPAGNDVVLKVESAMEYTLSGEAIWEDTLVNYEEVGYPEEQSKITNEFSYAVKNQKLCVELIAEGQEPQPFEFFCSVTPGQFSYWQEDGSPRTVYDYYRDGFFYPSMYLWLAALILLILGVLLLAIPGKKYELTVCEEAEEDNEETEEVTEEAVEEVTEEVVTETVETTEEPQE